MDNEKYNFKSLRVWQKSMELATKVYSLVKKLPPEERYALSDQMRRSALSIPSNIAEGKGRETERELLHFLSIAKGSSTELETQVLLGQQIGYFSKEDIEEVLDLIDNIQRMIAKYRTTILSKLPPHNS